MANFSHGESRRLYSWWWDSHVSPKNSKWLQENLTDMDSKVKAMIKLIEEDADSFARRAEMYYKKRPELMKLVEEFYRAYRALAERYDHATRALCQAHQTMTEAFPNQLPLMLPDESPSSSRNEMEPHTPEMPLPIRALFNSDDSHNDHYVVPSSFHVTKRNGAYTEEENDVLMGRKGLKQLNEMFSNEEGESCANLAERKARKVLNFEVEIGKSSEFKTRNWTNNHGNQESRESEDATNGIRCQQELSQLTAENQSLRSQVTSETERADKAESEVQRLKDTLCNLESEMESSLFKYQQSTERMSILEAQLSHTQDECKKLSDDIQIGLLKLNSTEERCLSLEKSNQSLQSELDKVEQESKTHEEELIKMQEEFEKLNLFIQDEDRRRMEAEMALMSVEKLHTRSQEDMKILGLVIQRGIDKLKDVEFLNMELEERIFKLKEENDNLTEENLTSSLKIKNLQEEVNILTKTMRNLEEEMGIHLREKEALQHEIGNVKEDKNGLELKHQFLTKEMEAISSSAVSLHSLVKERQEEADKLREVCKKHEDEKLLLFEDLKYMKKKSEKNAVLETSLSDANVELEGTREKMKELEVSCLYLSGKITSHINEKSMLVSQVEVTAQNIEKLSEKNAFLENSLSDMNVELECTRGKLKEVEKSYQFLYDQKANLLDERNNLVHQVEVTAQIIEKLSEKNAFLENSLSKMNAELECTRGKLKEIEESFQFLYDQKVDLLDKRNNLVHQVEVKAQNIEKLSEKNAFLENSVSDMNAEIECIRGKLKEMEKSYQFLYDQKANLLDERNNLVHQVETTIQSLENLEIMRAGLEDKYSRLVGERDSALHQVMELEGILNLVKQKHESLFQSSNSQLVALEEEIFILQEEIRVRERESEVDQQKIISALIETFILKNCLSDTEEKSLILSNDCWKHLEATRTAEELVFQLKQEHLIQKGNVASLLNHYEKLREEIRLILRTLNIKKFESTGGVKDEELLQIIFAESRNLIDSISDGQDEIQHLQVELSVVFTILMQIELNSKDLMEEHGILKRELEIRNQEQLICQTKKQELMELNEQLRQEARNRGQREVELKAETEALHCQLAESQKAQRTSEDQVYKLFGQNQSLSLEKNALEESYKSLYVQKDNLIAERNALISQVESISQSLENLKGRHSELDGKHWRLEREKDLTLAQLTELEGLLRVDKQENQNMICILQEERQIREEESEAEQQKLTSALIEIFILQKCLCETKEQTSIHLKQCEKYLQSSRSSEKLVSQLKQEDIVQKELMQSLLKDNEKLKGGILLLLRELNIDQEFSSVDEELFLIILSEIKRLMDSTTNAQHKIQNLQVQMLVFPTVLKQMGLDFDDLRMEKSHLKWEIKTQNEELLVLQNSKKELLELNEQLRKDSEAKIYYLSEINQSLSAENDKLQEENSMVLTEAMKLEHLYVLFKSFNTESTLELKLCNDDIDCLHTVRSNLDNKMRTMISEMSALQAENMHLRESVSYLEEYRDQQIVLEFDLYAAKGVGEELNYQFENGEDLLVHKEIELSEANEKVQSIQKMNGELSRNLAGLNQDINRAKLAREELELSILVSSEDIASRDKVITSISDANEMLHRKLENLVSEVEVLRRREECLTSDVQKGNDDIDQCRIDTMKLLNEIHISTVNAAIFEENVFELILACESLEIRGIVQREVLYEEIISRDAHISLLRKNIDDAERENRGLKANLNAYLPLVISLSSSIQSVEEKTYSLARLPASNKPEKQNKISSSDEDCSTMFPAGLRGIRQLIAKIDALKKILTELNSSLEEERPNDITNLGPVHPRNDEWLSLKEERKVTEGKWLSFERGRKDIEGLKVKGSSIEEEELINEDIIMELNQQGTDHEAQKDDAEISKLEYRQIMEQRLNATATFGLVGTQSEEARKVLQGIKVEESSSEEKGSINKDVIKEQNQNGEEHGIHNKSNKDEAAISKLKFRQVMKDIQLDEVSSSSLHGLTSIERCQTEDQMLELWEAAERECTIEKRNLDPAGTVHDIETMEEEKSEHPSSELLAEKELRIKRHAGPTIEEWKQNITQMLVTDARRLSVLRMSTKELKGKMEFYENKKYHKGLEYETIKTKLKVATESILELIEANSNLTEKSEDYPASSKEAGMMYRTWIFERARSGSETIGTLELEVQKIQYILLKLEEEQTNRTRALDRRPQVLLKEYIYERREKLRKKKRYFCGCIRPKTNND